MRLRALRNLCGWSRPELARRADLSPLTITSYEIAKVQPSAAALGRLADALGCQIDALFRRGPDDLREYTSATAEAMPPMTDDECRAVGLILRRIDARRATQTRIDDQATTG